MKNTWLIGVLSMIVAGCSSPGASNPLTLAPTQQDWQTAFSRLSLAEQTAITSKLLSVGLDGTQLDGSIYAIINGNGSNQLVESERLDIAAICDGFNRAFGQGAVNKWQLVIARSYDDLMTPAGVQTHFFNLNWKFRSSVGKTVSASAAAFGPGVKIIWGASPEAIAAEANQAFALTFLKLVAKLGNPQPGA